MALRVRAWTGSDEEDHRDGGADHDHSHAQHGLREPAPEPPPIWPPTSGTSREDASRLPRDMAAQREYRSRIRGWPA